MKDRKQRVTIDLPEILHKKLKMLSAMEDKSMRDIFIEAFGLLEENNKLKDEIKLLKHRLYRLEYDKRNDYYL